MSRLPGAGVVMKKAVAGLLVVLAVLFWAGSGWCSYDREWHDEDFCRVLMANDNSALMAVVMIRKSAADEFYWEVTSKSTYGFPGFIGSLDGSSFPDVGSHIVIRGLMEGGDGVSSGGPVTTAQDGFYEAVDALYSWNSGPWRVIHFSVARGTEGGYFTRYQGDLVIGCLIALGFLVSFRSHI